LFLVLCSYYAENKMFSVFLVGSAFVTMIFPFHLSKIKSLFIYEITSGKGK
jgi:hypothetical protein